METAVAILKEHTPTALMLLVAGFLLQNDLGGDIQEIRAETETPASPMPLSDNSP